MATFKKKDLVEIVGGDINSDGGDRNPISNSEIETGPVEKPFNDTSDYEKGRPTTTDKVFARYRQNIPWFAVYSFGGLGTRGMRLMETKKVLTKKTVEEKIEDLVKKSKISDLTDKDYNPKVSKLIDSLNNDELSDKQLEELEKLIQTKKNKEEKSKSKNL
jgi:hypothetical protein